MLTWGVVNRICQNYRKKYHLLYAQLTRYTIITFHRKLLDQLVFFLKPNSEITVSRGKEIKKTYTSQSINLFKGHVFKHHHIEI